MPKARDFDAELQYIKNKLPQAGFFSTLDELIRAAPQKQMPLQQWQNYLKPGTTLTRGGINFPLKAEELQYSGLPDLFADPRAFGGPKGVHQDSLLNYLHQNRSGFNVNAGIQDRRPLGPGGAQKKRFPREMTAIEDLDDKMKGFDPGANGEIGVESVRDPNALTAADYETRGYPQVTDAEHESYAHKPSIPNSYEVNVTTSPNFGTYQSHFSPNDLSWSRTTRHQLPPSGPMPEQPPASYLNKDPETLLGLHDIMGEERYDPNQGNLFGVRGWSADKAIADLRRQLQGPVDTRPPGSARLIEEIQSDRHQAAADKYSQPNQEQANEIKFLSDQNSQIHDDYDRNRISYEQQQKLRDPLEQRIRELKDASMTRRGYATPADEEWDRAFGQLPEATADWYQAQLPAEEQARLHQIGNMPPDTPFKDPKDYGLLELKKQLLNSVEQGDSRLALASGEDNADRYAPGTDANRDKGMRYMYDTIYPSAMKKLAAQYQIPYGPTTIPMQSEVHPVDRLYQQHFPPDEEGEAPESLGQGIDYMRALETPFPEQYETLRKVTQDLHDMIPNAERKPTHEITRNLINQHLSDAEEMRNQSERMNDPPNEWNPDHMFEPDYISQNMLNKSASDSEKMAIDQMRYLEKGARKAPSIPENKTFQNSMEITPEVADRIRKVGVPLWMAAGATGAGSLFAKDQANATPVEDQSMADANGGYAKGGQVNFALRRLLAQIREAPELQDAAKAAGTYEKGEAVLPKPAVEPPAPTMPQQMAGQIVNNAQVQRAATQLPPDKLAARLRGGDLVEPGELNHLLYADPETNAAINAYQGAMDKSAMSGQSVDPNAKNALIAVLDKKAAAPPSVLNPQQTNSMFDPVMSAGGSVFDPISFARERAGYADGGSVKEIADITDKLGGQKRFTTGVARQLYGLDASGQPAFGGRAWTQGQGGTPMGLLDEIASTPHSLISLAKTVRGFDPFRRNATYNSAMNQTDSVLDKLDPQWSIDASDRLDKLRDAVNQQAGIGDPQGIKDHLVDAAASLVTPIPMSKAGEDASFLKRALEMTTPLRPTTAARFAGDTAIMGGTSTAIDMLAERLAKLKASKQPQALDPTALPTSDPTQFSADMGVHPEEGTIYPPISRSAGMQPLPTGGQGIPPETFAGGGGVSRRGFLQGALSAGALTLPALKALKESIIEAPATTERAAMTKTADPAIAQRLAAAKDALFGSSQGPDFALAEQHLAGVPESANALRRLAHIQEAYSLGHLDDSGSERAAWQGMEHSIDDLTQQHGHERIPNPEDDSHAVVDPKNPTPFFSEEFQGLNPNDPEDKKLLDFHQALTKHILETGQSEDSLLAHYMSEPYTYEPNALNRNYSGTKYGQPDSLISKLTAHDPGMVDYFIDHLEDKFGD